MDDYWPSKLRDAMLSAWGEMASLLGWWALNEWLPLDCILPVMNGWMTTSPIKTRTGNDQTQHDCFLLTGIIVSGAQTRCLTGAFWS